MYHDQPPEKMKKTPLGDMQNYQSGFTYNSSRKSFHGAQRTEEVAKRSVMKRVTPKSPPQLPQLSLTNNSVTVDLIGHSVQKSDIVVAKSRDHITRADESFLNVNGRVHTPSEATQEKMEKQHGCKPYGAEISSQDATASLLGYPTCTPFPTTFTKRTAGDLAATERLRQKVNTEPIRGSVDEQSNERLIHLQKLLKQIDESDQSDYRQRLLHLSPLELSRHAVELEKRSMQLSVEEAMEIKRMQTLNFFGNSSRI